MPLNRNPQERPFVIIGERLTSGNPSVKAAILDRDKSIVKELALDQAIAGADYLDIGASTLASDGEADHLVWLASTVQEAVGLPLSLDCQDPTALCATLALCRRPPILNSFSGIVAQPRELLSIIRENIENIAGVVAVCISAWGERTPPSKRLHIAERLAEQLANAGVAEEKMIFDPVTLPRSAGQEAEQATLAATSLLRERFPKSGILCAVSNYSYGLTVRWPANRLYSMLAKDAGADIFLCGAPLSALMIALHLASCGVGPECHE